MHSLKKIQNYNLGIFLPVLNKQTSLKYIKYYLKGVSGNIYHNAKSWDGMG